MAIDTITQQAAFLNGSDDVTKSPPITRTQGTIVSVQGDGSATINIAGDPEPVPGIMSFTGYTPHALDMVELEVQGTDTIILGKLGNAPAPTAAFAAVATAVARAATTFGALSGSAGPSVAVTVGASGVLEVVISAEIAVASDNDGGAVGVALSGANTVAADYARALKFYPVTDTALVQGSRTIYFTGLTPGATTVTMQYSDLLDTGDDVTYGNRELLVKPL